VTGTVATPRIIGFLAAPGPTFDLAERLAKEVPESLARADGGEPWEARAELDPASPSADDPIELFDVDGQEGGIGEIDALRGRAEREGWSLAVCLTDLPLRAGGRVLIAEAPADTQYALLSMPALGPGRRVARARGAVVRIVESHEEGNDALRLLAPPVRGHVRLAAGLVWANRPWRIVARLSYMLAAGLATAAFSLATNTIWQLADTLGVVRLAVVAVLAVIAMVGWLAHVHGLWEHPRGSGIPERAVLFNVVSAVSLTLGVLSLYATLFVMTFIAALLTLTGSVLHQTLGHAAHFSDYLELAWLTTSFATVGGALGSGLEKEIDVREAAYAFHPERAASEEGDGSGS
jgi:hypothetical protein